MDVGEHPVVLLVTDSDRLSGTQSFTLTVKVNDAPSFASTPVTTATQGMLYTYAITTTDPDLPYGDVLTITAPTLPAWLALTDHDDDTATARRRLPARRHRPIWIVATTGSCCG